MCTRVCAAEPSSRCMSVLTAMKSTPSTWASIMRLTALTPAPPTPTTRSFGSVTPADIELIIGSCEGTTGSWGSGAWSRMFSGMSDEEKTNSRSSRAGHALVAAPALLALAPALLALLGAAGSLGHAGRRTRTRFRRSAPARRAGLARTRSDTVACAPGAPARGASSVGRGRPWAAGGRPSAPARACGSRRPAAARPPPSCGRAARRALAHARPVTACHSQGPPQLAGGRRSAFPSRSYLNTDMPLTGASANRARSC